MREKTIDSLNMVPFIDVMLVLLTIVLTTSSFIASGRIAVNLPQASPSAPDSSKTLTIEIDAEGRVFYGGAETTLTRLETELSGLDKSTAFLLRADKTIRLQLFIDAADLLKRLGFSSVAVQVENGR
jgi:biopolymer transport protein ExbD